jgi:hypothetical protein
MDNDWINSRLEDALRASPVADTVVTVIREQLYGTLCERALRGGEAADLAKVLLAAVNKSETEAKA